MCNSLTGTELDCIIEPKGGHGKDAVDELGGFFVMTNTNFEGAETSNSGDFNTTNDFRRYQLLKTRIQVVQLTYNYIKSVKSILLSGSLGSFYSR